MKNSDLRHSVLNSPGACCLLTARAAMSAEKHGRPLDEHILSYARQDQKLREAIQTAAGVSLRNVAEIIDEERREFWYARMREAEKSRERAESLAEFVREVTAIAESVLPGVYFDAVQHELA